MESKIEFTMKCEKCERDCESLIKLKDSNKTKKFRNKRKNGKVVKIKKVCTGCAINLLKNQEYEFGTYWRNFLIQNRYVWLSHHTKFTKQFDKRYSSIQ